MNNAITSAIEKALALGFYATHLRSAPDPFMALPQGGFDWQAQSPESFYAIPDTPPNLQFTKGGPGLISMRARFTFPSPFSSPHTANNTVHGVANLRVRGEARAALVIVHGHTMTDFNVLERYARPATWAGFDIYYLSLPYHMQRAPHPTWSGQYSLNSDIHGTAQSFRQGVMDVRSLITWIEREHGIPVILVGISLGAYTCCMTAVVDERPRTVVSILGGGSLAQLIWDGYQRNRSRHQLEARGISLNQLEQYWKLLGPANWLPKVARDRILLMAGEFDPIVTPENVNRLWRAWDHPAVHWYPCGHTSIVTYNRSVRREIFRFLVDRL